LARLEWMIVLRSVLRIASVTFLSPSRDGNGTHHAAARRGYAPSTEKYSFNAARCVRVALTGAAVSS